MQQNCSLLMNTYNLILSNWKTSSLRLPDSKDRFPELSSLVRATEQTVEELKLHPEFRGLVKQLQIRNDFGYPMLEEKSRRTEDALYICGTGKEVSVRFESEVRETLLPSDFYLGTLEMAKLLPLCFMEIRALVLIHQKPVIIPCLGDDFRFRSYSFSTNFIFWALDTDGKWYLKDVSFVDHGLRILDPLRLYPIGTLPS